MESLEERERDLGLEIVMAYHAYSSTEMGVVDSGKREPEDLNDLVQPKLKLPTSHNLFFKIKILPHNFHVRCSVVVFEGVTNIYIFKKQKNIYILLKNFK